MDKGNYNKMEIISGHLSHYVADLYNDNKKKVDTKINDV